MADIKFEVGKTYANRDGEYQVLSIDPASGRMEVRFLKGGLTRSLTMSTQSRIAQNLQIEARVAQAVEEAPARSKAPRATRKVAGREFKGLRPEDFRGTVTGTTWRNRGSLAGGVKAELERHFGKPFKSVAPYKWPRVYLSHQVEELSDPASSRKVAKYTVWADEQGLHFGLNVERVNEAAVDWPRLASRIREDGDLRKLLAQLEADGVRVDAVRERGQQLDELWPGDSTWESRATVMEAERPEEEVWNLTLSRSLPPEEAVARGTAIVDEIGEFMVRLAPVYEAATS